jgi:hypothetical protein
VHTLTIVPRPASEPGALDGFAAVCESCGVVGTASLLVLAESWYGDHVAYMAKVGK